MFVHSLAVLPAAAGGDIFDAGTTFVGRASQLLLVGAGMVVLFMVLKQLLSARTFMVAVGIILGGVFLAWLLTQYNNSNLKAPLDNTVKNVVNGSAQLPAGVHGNEPGLGAMLITPAGLGSGGWQ